MPTTWSTTDKSAGVTLSGGNLVATFTGASQGVRAIDRVYTGKYYWEATFTTPINLGIGICLGDSSLGLLSFSNAANTSVIVSAGAGLVLVFGGTVGITLGAFAAGAVACFALDASADLIWFRNGAAGNWNASASANPATGVGGLNIGTLSGLSGGGAVGFYPCASGGGGSGVATANFGATGFTGAVPAGFTSGFPSGTTLVNSAVVSQAAVEHWGPGAPVAQVTQTGLEVWGAISAVSRAALVTQLAVEQWASVPLPPVIASQSAVSVNTG